MACQCFLNGYHYYYPTLHTDIEVQLQVLQEMMCSSVAHVSRGPRQAKATLHRATRIQYRQYEEQWFLFREDTMLDHESWATCLIEIGHGNSKIPVA